MNPPELLDLMLETSKALQALIDAHDALVAREAEAEAKAKHAEAQALLGATGKTVSEREAQRDLACGTLRYEAHLARGLRESSKLAIHAKQAQLSALQSAASAMREEARLARVGDA